MASPVQFSRSRRVTSVLTRAIKVTAETGANASSWASSASSQLLLSKWKGISMTQRRFFCSKRQITAPGPGRGPGQAAKNVTSEGRTGRGGNSNLNPNGALSGITVLDFTRVLAGPFCTQFLGDLGAQIIKVEEPTKGDDTRGYGPPFFSDSPDGSKNSAYFVSVNRNKESIGVNLKDPRGVELIRQLASEVDVVIENFTPGVADRLGIGFDSLSKVNSSLIYCSISGFGQSGLHSRRPGYDVIASSIGGLLSITGPEFGDPCRPGVPIIDLITGLYATCAILTALYNRTNVQMENLIEGQLAYTSDVADASNCTAGSNTSGAVKAMQMNNNGNSVSSSDEVAPATGATCALMNNRWKKEKREDSSIPAREEETRDQGQEDKPQNWSPPSSPPQQGQGEREATAISKGNAGVTREMSHKDTRVTGPVKIDVNLLSSQISVLINIALNYLNFNLIANRRGTAHETIVPYQAFACKTAQGANDVSPHITDTKTSEEKAHEASPNKSPRATGSPDYLTVIAGNDGMFVKLIKLLFADEPTMVEQVLSNEKFKSNAGRQVNRQELICLLQKKFATRTRDEWLQLLLDSGLPYGPVNRIDQVFSDEDIKSRTTFTVDGVTYLKNAVTFESETQFHRRDFIPPAKSVGQDTRTILSSMLHLTQDQLHQLALDGVIRL